MDDATPAPPSGLGLRIRAAQEGQSAGDDGGSGWLASLGFPYQEPPPPWATAVPACFVRGSTALGTKEGCLVLSMNCGGKGQGCSLLIVRFIDACNANGGVENANCTIRLICRPRHQIGSALPGTLAKGVFPINTIVNQVFCTMEPCQGSLAEGTG